MELIKHINYLEFLKIKEVCKNKAKTIDVQGRMFKFSFKGLEKIGINELKVIYDCNLNKNIEMAKATGALSDFTFVLKMIINPGKLLTGNCLAVFHPWQFEELCYKFKMIMSSKFGFLADLKQWKVNRIDYCLQIQTAFKDEYLKLLQLGNKPKQGNFLAPYTKKQGYTVINELEKKQRKNSLYFKGGKYKNHKLKKGSYNVNFYLKGEQMKYYNKKIKHKYDIKSIEEAKDILRLEVQCLRSATRRLADTKDKCLSEFLSIEKAKKITFKKLKEITGIADYQTKAKALEMIENSHYQRRTKDRLKKLINIIRGTNGKSRTIWKMRLALQRDNDFFGYGGTVKQFDSDLRKLENINVNPVTIPNYYGIENLKNLRTLAEEYFSNIEAMAEVFQSQKTAI